MRFFQFSIVLMFFFCLFSASILCFQSQYRIFFSIVVPRFWSVWFFYSNAFIVFSSGFVLYLCFVVIFVVCVWMHQFEQALFGHKTASKPMEYITSFTEMLAQEDNWFCLYLFSRSPVSVALSVNLCVYSALGVHVCLFFFWRKSIWLRSIQLYYLLLFFLKKS